MVVAAGARRTARTSTEEPPRPATPSCTRACTGRPSAGEPATNAMARAPPRRRLAFVPGTVGAAGGARSAVLVRALSAPRRGAPPAAAQLRTCALLPALPAASSSSSSSSSSSPSSAPSTTTTTIAAVAAPSRTPEPPSPTPPFSSPGPQPPPPVVGPLRATVVLVLGFELFNRALYLSAAARAAEAGIRVHVFTDSDLADRADVVVHALRGADVLFASLIFDYDQVEWLRAQIEQHGTATLQAVFVFESALELMQETRVGSFTMAGSADPSVKREMPTQIKWLLQKFGILGREEDKLASYLRMLKSAPRLLKLIPGTAARDLRRWLEAYTLWNASGSDNVLALLEYLATEVLARPPLPEHVRPALSPKKQSETDTISEYPNIGLVHPARRSHCFANPAEYVQWYVNAFPERADWPRVALLLYRKHVVSGQQYVSELVEHFERRGLFPVPVFITGVEAHIIVRDYLTSHCEIDARSRGQRVYGSYRPRQSARVDAVVNTIGFPLVGGPAGSMAGGRAAGVAQRILRSMNVPYIVSCPLLIQEIESWQSSGIAGLQSVVLYALPELDGAIDSIPLGGLVGDRIQLLPDRLDRLTGRLHKWISLRRRPIEDRRIAILLYGFPPGIGACGTAALLNVPESLAGLIRRLHEEGYDVGNAHTLSGNDLVRIVKERDEIGQGGKLSGASVRQAMADISVVRADELQEWLGQDNTARIVSAWKAESSGGLGSSSHIKTSEGKHLLGGLRAGNVWIGVQPPLGIVGDPMRLLFERDLTPHPQYAALYRWLENDFKADAMIHMGAHGTVEWLPGSPLGSTAQSWPDILVGNVPVLYVYASNNPSESSIAKRRGFSTIVSHNVPPYGRAGLYKELVELKSLCAEWRDTDESKRPDVADVIFDQVYKAGLNSDLAMGSRDDIVARDFVDDDFIARLSEYLCVLEQRLFSSGLHVFGMSRSREDIYGYIEALLDEEDGQVPEEDRPALAHALAVLAVGDNEAHDVALLSKHAKLEVVQRARQCAELLVRSAAEELNSILRGLNGEYIDAAPAGDLLRDGPAVLPTGRNCYSLDPYRLPSMAAFQTGVAIAESVIKSHREKNGGAYPETIAVPLWGLDNIKTRGESVGMVLGFVGARPTLDGTGRVARFDLIPLEELGRPRVDVVCNLSGIFRDSFEHVVHLLDDMFARAAEVGCEKELDNNFIAKHTLAITSAGADESGHARLFSNPAGDFGSMVNERVASSNWNDGDELSDTYVDRNSFIYGRKGAGRKDKTGMLRKMLKTTDRVVQCIDSVEYGLSDIQEYYANTGALIRAARVESGKDVGASIVESFGGGGGGSRSPKAKELNEVLRLELRTRLLNPKWSEAMKKNGAGGAFEISTRMTALVGWGGTVDKSVDGFVFEQAAERYVADEEMREHLKSTSPEAFRNVVGRLIEAHGRGIWEDADENLLDLLRREYDDVEDKIEGV